jgi:hypothetical protein
MSQGFFATIIKEFDARTARSSDTVMTSVGIDTFES